MLVRIRNYIFTGLLVVLPLIVSITVLWWVFVKITNWAVRLFPYGLVTRISVPAALLVILALIGLVAKVVLIRKIFGLGERLLIKIPLFNKVYLTVKQISQAFLSPEKTMFRKVVLVEYPRKGLYSIGFVTSRSRGEVQTKTRDEVMNIFIPTTPNPTSGILIFAAPKEVIELDMSIEEGMKLVISGGTVVPPYIKG